MGRETLGSRLRPAHDAATAWGRGLGLQSTRSAATSAVPQSKIAEADGAGSSDPQAYSLGRKRRAWARRLRKVTGKSRADMACGDSFLYIACKFRGTCNHRVQVPNI